jgi:hypothetical protein
MDNARIEAGIKRHNGNISAVARALKVSRKTLYQHISANETLQQVLEDSRESMLDDAEDALQKAIKDGQPWAVCFALKTKGKSRGYVEKQEIEQSGEMKVTVQYVNAN